MAKPRLIFDRSYHSYRCQMIEAANFTDSQKSLLRQLSAMCPDYQQFFHPSFERADEVAAKKMAKDLRQLHKRGVLAVEWRGPVPDRIWMNLDAIDSAISA